MPPRRVVTGRSQEPRRRFAEEIRLLRTERKLSLRKLGEALGWDWSLFSKMESGHTVSSPDVVQALDHYYGTRGMLLVLWELAVGDTTQFLEQYRRYMSLEAEATSIQKYSPGVVPGLLQTEAYARETLTLGRPPSDEELDQQVRARVSRRDVLEGEEPPPFRAILDEAVLRRPLADGGEWCEQLKHLVEWAERWNITLQVLPFTAGVRELSHTDTSLLRLLDGRTVAWVETAYSGHLIEEAAKVEELQAGYDRLRDHALSPRDSVEFVLRLLEELS
ncbi:helix-turn-helix transcriptional regulator [Streptomyces sp. TRM 70361]|uniref:helix-turn-helix domain-containing protein n=1 Tax=Streptomyces sp. TRM 70361 TaxID=3116553 RepID=UPI002E7B17AF|nr:helix-turn-helix transcriptional regulator [Streptomyces sp. TRM 70361]MEE1942664.1 helix-turn-helix transcriptional regulator [Streptomyces sp. TRM 70361]